MYRRLVLAVFLVATCSTLHADDPTVSYIFPAGGQRGTTVNFNVGGHYLRAECPFEILGNGILTGNTIKRNTRTQWFEGPLIPMPASQAKEDYPVDQAGELSIAEDATLGFRRWRVWTSQGVIPTQKFVIGHLPEIIEQEIDGTPIPQDVTLPVTINGRVFPREDVDLWRFDAKAGKEYTVEVMAKRLGTGLDSHIEVLDSEGKRVAENGDWFGEDSFLRFKAEADGKHTVRIYDAAFGGLQHYVYRLTITDQEYVDHVFPLGGQRGKPLKLQLFGQMIPEEPVELSVSPDAADNWVFDLSHKGKTLRRLELDITNYPEVLESDEQRAATHTVPVVLNGRIQDVGEEDTWNLSATKGDVINLDLKAARLGSLLDSHLAVLDKDGKEIAKNDDIQNGLTDSKLAFTAPEDGTYHVVIKDRFGRFSAGQFSYRLVVSKPINLENGLKLTLPVDGLTVIRGQEGKLKVTAERVGGWKGPIELSVAGLPEHITLDGLTIAEGKSDTEIKIKPEDQSKIQATSITISGVGTVMTKEAAENEETPAETVNAVAVKLAENYLDIQQDALMLSVAMPTPFKIWGTFETKFAHRGSSYKRSMFIEREDYDGPIEIVMAERQVRHLQGVTGKPIYVPAGETGFTYQIQLPPWMEIGRTCRVAVTGIATITDHDGTEHLVSHTSHAQNDQIIVLVDASKMSIQAAVSSMQFAPGEAVPVTVTVNRGDKIQGNVSVSVTLPEHISAVTAESIVIPADKTEGILNVRFDDAPDAVFNMPLTVRARIDEGTEHHTAEDKIDIVK